MPKGSYATGTAMRLGFNYPIKTTGAGLATARDLAMGKKDLVTRAVRKFIKKNPALAAKIALSASAGPAAYTALLAGGTYAGTKALRKKKEKTASSFLDELSKIANLQRLAATAKADPVRGLAALLKDKKAQGEALARINALRRQGGLSPTLSSAPIPQKAPLGLRDRIKLTAWLAKNARKPGFRAEATTALDKAMALQL